MSERWTKHWNIYERIVIEGQLVLDSPAHFGNGDVSAVMDMPVMRDPVDGAFMLTGTSIAGALRAYLAAADEGVAGALFGQIHRELSVESALVVYDARGSQKTSELRDHVRLDPKTRTAADKAKFDMEVIEAGTTFNLRFDLHRAENESDLPGALAFALAGLQAPDEKQASGEIGLGKRKSRGFGQCHVSGWRVRRYKMDSFADLMAWIRDERTGAIECTDIQTALGGTKQEKQRPFVIRAAFGVEGSLMIRTDGANGQRANTPDSVHLTSRRGDAQKPIISGTALAGVLRARAGRITKTLNPNANANFLRLLFGDVRTKEDKDNKTEIGISRLRVSESVIEEPAELVHTRVKIDRFTGGAYPAGLFSEQPVFGKEGGTTQVTLNLELREPSAAQKGLLLLLLKDLWTGDLLVGGESSVGRGRLKGRSAIIFNEDGTDMTINMGKDDTLGVSEHDAKMLQTFVDAFVKEIKQ